MSQVLSNLGLSLPLQSKRSSQPWLNLKNPSSSSFCISAMAPDSSRNNLDHLQRTNGKQQLNQQNQPLPRRKVASSAPIGLWDRFPAARTVQQMMDTMERLVEDPLAYSSLSYPLQQQMEGRGYNRGRRTPWEIKEGESEYKLRFDMPGMTRQDVKVWVEEKMLVVKAEKVVIKKQGDDQEEEGEGDDWSAKSYGKYSFTIALPENAEFEKIKAEVKDGVLYLSIPKASSRSKVFDISVE